GNHRAMAIIVNPSAFRTIDAQSPCAFGGGKFLTSAADPRVDNDDCDPGACAQSPSFVGTDPNQDVIKSCLLPVSANRFFLITWHGSPESRNIGFELSAKFRGSPAYFRCRFLCGVGKISEFRVYAYQGVLHRRIKAVQAMLSFRQSAATLQTT